ncbi:hypothetical protein HG535_0D02650 [Zygotorulaspora mrakii]|uniref:Mitochondrial FAD carrier protein FLX1 n=1 Tax=Zygotorulaspora mrakii TaxID=42260 RepID=A0A7H9B238_ZYGMR|nr:uncharacterized protein HG535_0D02650 [Zygotorulaspora mrakii]QLG72557.1 hypothetical protein HG535_0D02650 [Zygotorulaspora mrakii]
MVDALTPIQKELVAGLTTGALTTVVVHPLDLIKIRLQLLATSTTKLGYRYIFGSISRSADTNPIKGGLLRELYRGLGINLFGNAVAWGLYFGLYRTSKDMLYDYKAVHVSGTKNDVQKDSKMSSLMFLSAGALSGIITAVLTNPIWVIKTRIMSTSSSDHYSYKSTLNGVKRLLSEEGPRSFWRGLIPSLFGVSQGAIYFMIYDTLKYRFSSLRHYSDDEKSNKGLKNSEIFVISSASKLISVTAVYPFQLLKSNLQCFDAREKKYTMNRLINFIYGTEGVKGFYKGLSANLFRAIPSTCITFGIYENLKSLL